MKPKISQTQHKFHVQEEKQVACGEIICISDDDVEEIKNTSMEHDKKQAEESKRTMEEVCGTKTGALIGIEDTDVRMQIHSSAIFNERCDGQNEAIWKTDGIPVLGQTLVNEEPSEDRNLLPGTSDIGFDSLENQHALEFNFFEENAVLQDLYSNNVNYEDGLSSWLPDETGKDVDLGITSDIVINPNTSDFIIGANEENLFAKETHNQLGGLITKHDNNYAKPSLILEGDPFIVRNQKEGDITMDEAKSTNQQSQLEPAANGQYPSSAEKNAELQKRLDEEIRINKRYEKELHLMNIVLNDYRKAIKEMNKSDAIRAKHDQQHAESLYRDHPDGNGKVITVAEWEKLMQERKIREDQSIILEMMDNFQDGFFSELEEHILKLDMLSGRLSGCVDSLNLLKTKASRS